MATKTTKRAAQAASPSTITPATAPAVAKIQALDRPAVYAVGFDEGHYFQPMRKADGTLARFATEQEALNFLSADLKDFDKKYKAAAGA